MFLIYMVGEREKWRRKRFSLGVTEGAFVSWAFSIA
jgi:hypothetical protein